MRRDFNGEILVALFAVGVLALALVFGIVLTISRNVATPVASTGTASVTAGAGTAGTTVANDISPTPEDTATATEAVTNVDIPTVAPATVTSTPTEKPDATATEAPTSTETSGATLQPNSEGTVSAETASATIGATATKTASTAPTSTQTASLRPSNTATITPSTTASLTPSRTATITPSKTITPQPTYTPIPSLTPFPTFTPQATYTPFPSFTPAPTQTPSRTATRTMSPTPTLSIPTVRAVTQAPATQVPTNAPISGGGGTASAPCSRPDNWVAYIVQRGDTLFSIARQAGITVAELQRANCLTSDRIDIGQVLAVPPGSSISRPTVTGGTSAAPGVTPGVSDVLPGINIVQCGDASVQITAPRPGITVSGTISIFGSAIVPNFNFYKLEIRNEANPNWTTFLSSPTPIQGGLLGQINTAQFPAGAYWVQVTAIDNTSNYPVLPCAIRLYFAN